MIGRLTIAAFLVRLLLSCAVCTAIGLPINMLLASTMRRAFRNNDRINNSASFRRYVGTDPAPFIVTLVDTLWWAIPLAIAFAWADAYAA